jgi:hypothetical protein
MGRSRAPRRAVIGRPQTPSLRELGSRIHETTEGYGHAPRAQFDARAAAMENGANMAAYERENRPTRAQMLDPRYGDPDWTPWSQFGGNLPEGADERDRQRVEETGGTWTL